MEEEVVEKLKETTECHVCLECFDGQLRRPLVLECLHVFCSCCLEQLSKRAREEILCPDCKSPSKIPNGGASNFRVAFWVNKILDIVDPQGKIKHFCTGHKDREVELYCETCRVFICINCILRKGKHYNHDYLEIKDAFKKFKLEVESSQKRLFKQVSNTEQALKALNKYRHNLKEKQFTIADDLGTDVRKTFLMDQIFQISHGKLKNLASEEVKLKNAQSRIKGCLEFLTKSMQCGNHYAVLSMRTEVLAKIKELKAPIRSDLFFAVLADIPAVGYSMNITLHKVPSTDKQIQLPPLYLLAYPACETQTYFNTLLQLPTAFYYNAQTGIILTGEFVKQKAFPTSSISGSEEKLSRRSKHDSYKPPYGPKLQYLTSVGYGKEVGLPDGFQEVYNPQTQKTFILDHNNFKISTDVDRVQPYKKITVKQVHHNVGDKTVSSMPTNLCYRTAVIQKAFDRSKSKPVGCTLSFRGKNGENGLNGYPGKHGVGGCRYGIDGGSGEDGSNGTDGKPGEHGNRGGDAILTLSGSPDLLEITGSVNIKIPLGGTRSEQIVLIDCHGGNGGRGGCGGNGGNGGNGCDGGNGANGTNGRRGQTGECGQDGGDGGNGGYGGQGGDAGDGGNAGDGGKCVIKTQDPRLLMLVEVDLMPGEPGVGNRGGTGGSRGAAGSGGSGGEGGKRGPPIINSSSYGEYNEYTMKYYHYPSPGLHGRRGRPGKQGRAGVKGSDSRAGRKGQNGGFLWVVTRDSSVATEAGSRYNAQVETLKVSPIFDDGIFEPHERICISEVKLHNIGGLDLPSGAYISFPSTQFIKFESSQFEIPENALPAGKKYTLPFKFHGRITDFPPPNVAGPLSYKVQFSPRIELLGRPFGNLYKEDLSIQYPIQLGSLYSPEIMDQGEVAVFSVEIKNLSNIMYGNCKESGGRAVLHLHFDSRLIPMGTDTKVPYTMTYDHTLADSTFIEIQKLPPKQKTLVCFKVLMEGNAEVFDECHWQVDLLLRDKLIEYNHKMTKVVPTYNAMSDSADVLLVTDDVMTRQEFVIWSNILNLVGVSYDIWDTARYHGLSFNGNTDKRHENTWLGRYCGKMILYPHCNIKLLAGADIAQHFHADCYNEKPLLELNSSLVLYMSLPRSTEMSVLRHLAPVQASVEIPPNSYKGKHMHKPDPCSETPPYAKCELNIIKKVEEGDLKQAPLLFTRKCDITRTGPLTYSYGTIDVRQVPVLKSSKFLIVSDTEKLNPSATDKGSDQVARYSQALLAILYGVSIPTKLKLMKLSPTGDKVIHTIFYLPDGSTASIEEIVMITLVKEIIDELFTLTTQVDRMKMFHDDIHDNIDSYIHCGRTILRGLKLIDKEYSKIRSAGLKHIFAHQGFKKISEMSKKITKTFASHGVKASKLEKMFSLNELQSCKNFRFCHQHFVDDKMWNLADK